MFFIFEFDLCTWFPLGEAAPARFLSLMLMRPSLILIFLYTIKNISAQYFCRELTIRVVDPWLPVPLSLALTRSGSSPPLRGQVLTDYLAVSRYLFSVDRSKIMWMSGIEHIESQFETVAPSACQLQRCQWRDSEREPERNTSRERT